jgi:hypothetical protein
MQQNPSLGPDSRSTDQEIPDTLWNSKVHYLVHMNPSLDLP